MSMKRPKGFTLIELIISMALSVAVLLGVISVATSMVRYQFDATRKGNITGMTLVGLTRMNKEIEEATTLALPVNTGDALSGCTNWTRSTAPPQKIDPNLDPDGGGPRTTANNVTAFYYCESANNLYRHFNYGDGTNCPMTPPTCGSGCPSATCELLILGNFRHFNEDVAIPYFRRANDVSGVLVQYLVGTKVVTAQNPNPPFYEFSLKIGMNKSYMNVND